VARPEPIYLDHMASTPLDPRVRDAMLPWLDAVAVGNPHSAHGAGWRAGAAVDGARAEVAALIGAASGEIILTSSASEANHLALFGASRAGGTVLASAVEHPSVLACLPELERRGRRTGVVPVDGRGVVRLDALEQALSDAGAGALVSVMAANHEVGTIQPLAEVAALARAAGALIHSDATQFLSSGRLDVRALGVDLLSLSGHKLYGPQGIGALRVRDGVAFEPTLRGGGQQGGRRAGTVPVALAVGLGVACRILPSEGEQGLSRIRDLRDRLWQGLHRTLPDAVRNGADDGLPHCLSVTSPGIDAADLLLDLPELCASTGSACASDAPGPSPVLLAMGRSAEEAHATMRFGLGRFTTVDEIDRALTLLAGSLRAEGVLAAAVAQ
jgi:cysteine desulfurase